MILNAFSVLTASQNGNGLWRHRTVLAVTAALLTRAATS